MKISDASSSHPIRLHLSLNGVFDEAFNLIIKRGIALSESELDRKINKIKKCLDLAASSNEHESARALEMAQAYMSKYGLCESDIELSRISDSFSVETIQKKPKLYISELMFAIDRAFGVKSIYSQKLNDQGKVKNHSLFIGEKSSATLAAYAFDVCITSINRARREFLKGLHKNCKQKTKDARCDSFSLGFVRAISKNLPSMDVTQNLESNIAAYMEKKFGELKVVKSYNSAKNISGASSVKKINESMLSGFSSGNKVNIRQPMSGSESIKIGHTR